MQELINLLHQHGLLLVFLVTLASRVGLPVPAAPLIVVAGGLVATQRMALLDLLLVSVLANVIADWVWYAAGRHYGSRIMRLVCRVSQSPDSCVLESEGMLTRWGGGSLVLAKFIPGVSLVAPPMTGAMRMPFWQFVFYDAVAALVWTLAYLLLGLVFRHQIEQVLAAMEQATWLALGLVGVLVVLFGGYRIWQRHRLKQVQSIVRMAPEELMQRMQQGWQPLILDVRSREMTALEPDGLPGAQRVDMAQLRTQMSDEERERPIVVYCNCPGDVSAAQAARRLRGLGFRQVWPLLGGLDGWLEAGHGVQPVSEYLPARCNKADVVLQRGV
ncbi:DedA family protein/thiosulfate sulfurtransferase GlpE [Brachymonas sp. J145]|uniref:DedA family protein/thiosulfate sulfurtransferase GlpE n=1 Tax=Brachymonas sp. J145 TaxID=3116489 RepID=UPI002E781418|nr:DedA family protein/thiosulfate sulfurtransferase GlpE [Brachymonas sp. J145]MEE1652983.1 DedA family protein/thiosulfate sulfurtransferase GlpE [Brachymonas sp. J145]